MSYDAPFNSSARVSEYKLREQMCDIGRRIWQRGLCAGNDGNHSFRLSDGRVLCTPTGVSKGFMRPEDMVVVDMDGKPAGGTSKRQRTSEIFLHLAVYKARPDVRCVIHNHPPHATAFALAGVDLPTGIYPEAEALLGPVATARYVLPGDQRLGETILPFVKDANTILLQNHGVVCYDTNLEACYHRLEVVDQYARILLMLKQIGSVRALTPDEMREVLELKARLGLPDPRLRGGTAALPRAAADSVDPCRNDFIARIGEAEEIGRVQCPGGGTAPAPAHACSCGQQAGGNGQGHGSALEQAVAALAPPQYSEEDIEQLVQVITDQIMATAGEVVP